MSHHYTYATSLPAGGEQVKGDKIAKVKNICLIVGLVGLIISIVLLAPALFGHPDRDSLANSYSFSWLFALEVTFTITVGTLFWVLLHNASNSGWGVAIRRIPETFSNNLWLVGVLGLPLVLVPQIRETVWTWIGMQQEIFQAAPPVGVSGERDVLHHAGHGAHLLYVKYPLLNLHFFGILPGWIYRFFVYFVALGFGAWKMRQYSLSQDSTGRVHTTFSARRFACGFLPLFAVTATFAAFDWVKSLNYSWFSTMFGVNVFAASALSSMAVIIIIVGFLKNSGHFEHVVSEEHFHTMGKLMHAFVIFWAYITFSQYFLTWYANISEETQFFAIRNTGGWWYLSLALTFGHFVLPFVLLLKRSLKKNIKAVMFIAALILCVHILECYWWILPQRGPVLYDFSNAPTMGRTLLDFVLDMMALATFFGLSGFFFFKRLATASIYPCGDPRLEESINLKN